MRLLSVICLTQLLHKGEDISLNCVDIKCNYSWRYPRVHRAQLAGYDRENTAFGWCVTAAKSAKGKVQKQLGGNQTHFQEFSSEAL